MILDLPASSGAVLAPSVDPTTGPFEALLPLLRAALETRGYTALTAVQSAVLAAEVGGRDLQISSQTGSGKTVALGFVLAPILVGPQRGQGPDTLIIVPTRELATQVCAELRWLFADLQGVQVASVTGGSPLHRDRQLLARHPRVLVGTPGRLLDHVKSGVLDLSHVGELVLDEADQMLDMGFREELEGILDTTPVTRRTHMVSATFPDGIQRLAERYQRNPLAIEGTRLGDANQDIEHQGHLVHSRDRYATLVNLLLQADGERVLVFVQLRAEAVELAEKLEADGFAALPLSGELIQSQRERTLAAFRDGRATVLVATDVAARGLDVPDVTSVIHTAPPKDAQVYTHRSGRTGRAGKRGRSVLLTPPNRRRRVTSLLNQAGVDLRWLPVPSAAQVRSELAKRARAALEAELVSSLTAGPAEGHLAHARELLANHGAAPLVAALLARLEPERRAQPKDVENLSVKDIPRQTQRTKPGNSVRVASTGMVRFFVNRGVKQGANPSRILATVCRRGDVKGGDIGSIAIHPNASTFDVSAEVAERFERQVSRRDKRDPQTVIRRDRGPVQTGRVRKRS